MKQSTRITTREQVRADFERKGVSISAWARQHGVGRSLVYEILTGARSRTCSRGQSHRIAVLLGLKAGELVDGPEAINAAGHTRALKRAA